MKAKKKQKNYMLFLSQIESTKSKTINNSPSHFSSCINARSNIKISIRCPQHLITKNKFGSFENIKGGTSVNLKTIKRAEMDNINKNKGANQNLISSPSSTFHINMIKDEEDHLSNQNISPNFSNNSENKLTYSNSSHNLKYEIKSNHINQFSMLASPTKLKTSTFYNQHLTEEKAQNLIKEQQEMRKSFYNANAKQQKIDTSYKNNNIFKKDQFGKRSASTQALKLPLIKKRSPINFNY